MERVRFLPREETEADDLSADRSGLSPPGLESAAALAVPGGENPFKEHLYIPLYDAFVKGLTVVEKPNLRLKQKKKAG
jgi:hypothetical protein